MAERLNSAYTLLKQAVPTVKQSCSGCCMRSGTPCERKEEDIKMSKNIRYRMCRALEEKIRLGVGKRAIERKTGKNSPFIHSAATARTYMQQAQEYGSWLAAQGMNRCTMEQAREMATEYIKSFESASTQHTIRSALAKVFDCRGEEICRLGKRDPADFTRGRTPTDRTAAIERNHPELAEACRSMGLRNDRELKQLTASDLHRGADGHLYAHVRGKGGRERDTLILPGKGEQIVLEAARSRPEGPLFDVPSHANVHGWRADYAARCYAYAMDSGYGTGELYKLRNGSGKAYDRGALAFVSANLGHGPDRYYTVCYNYLSYGKAEA